MKTLLISFDPQTVEKYDSFNPDFISYEKEDLIGTGVSMIKSEEENIKNLIKVLKKPLIIGAGISNGQDVKSAVTLGAKGVILASGFVLSENPEGELRELAQGFKQ